MNLVGKILTVLIFVMSLCFMMMAVMVYSTHVNWRDKVIAEAGPGRKAGLQSQLKDLTRERNDLAGQLKTAVDTLEDEKAAKRDRVAKLENKRDELKRERDQREAEVQSLNTTTAEAVSVMERTLATLSAQHTELVRVREDKRKAAEERDISFTKIVEMTDELHQLQNEKTRLEERQITLISDRQRMRDVLRAHDINPATDPATILPRTSGLVSATPGKGLIQVNIGSDDGLKKGHSLEVYRIGSGSKSTTYLGRVEIVDTQPDKAVCKIIPEYRKGAINRGDRVTSKL